MQSECKVVFLAGNPCSTASKASHGAVQMLSLQPCPVQPPISPCGSGRAARADAEGAGGDEDGAAGGESGEGGVEFGFLAEAFVA